MWAIVANIGSLLGIIGVSLTNVFSDAIKAWIAVGAFVALAAYGAWTIYRVSKVAMLRRYPKGYAPLSSSARYTTSDGKLATYEVYRHIQVKQPVMRHFEHRFFWSGSKDPKIASDIQTCSEVMSVPNERTKLIRLKYPNPRIYNDVEIIHIKMNLDDTDGAAKPFLSLKIEEPIRLMNFRVELLHLQNGKYAGQHAIVSRTPLEQGHVAVEEVITQVPFDLNTRSFYFQAVNPEPGYQYRIEWPQAAPAPQRQRGKKKAAGTAQVVAQP